MGTEVQPRPEAKRRTVAMAVGASLLLVLFVLGLAFANSVGAAQVAENAASLHWANATSGNSALARAALAQALTFAELHAAEVHVDDEGDHSGQLVTHDDVQFALDQVEASHDELQHLLDLGGASPSAASLTHFLAPMAKAMTALEAGDTETAGALIATEVEVAYIELADSLRAEQDAVQTLIEQNTESAGRLNGFALFFLTLAIPAAAVVVYWSIARRQVRELRIKSETELEAERSISRAKDSFIAGLSHELRTPLTSIYGFAEILTDGDIGEDSQTEEVAQIIANESAEMTRMVDDLLTASRLESTGVEIELATTNVVDVVESAVTPFARAGLAIKKTPTPALVFADGARLRHVLVNLISNAARHGGDQIGIEISPGEDSVDIEVWDTGDGVPESQIERLFERFIHNGAEPLLTGSIGLGLAVASRLTSMMGGRLSYQRFGGKTYFIVNLPAVEAEPDGTDESESVASKIKALSQ